MSAGDVKGIAENFMGQPELEDCVKAKCGTRTADPSPPSAIEAAAGFGMTGHKWLSSVFRWWLFCR
jgi:hypothetical protein